jgi:hypothetical protein
MGGFMLPLLWAQAAGGPSDGASPAGPGAALTNPAAMAQLALRRWCSGLTLSSPHTAPTLDGLWAFLAGLAVLLCVGLLLQGPAQAIKQLIDLPGHARLWRRATARVWRAGRLVSVAITFTVLSWTGSQTLGFLADRTARGKNDLTLLTHSRGRLELGVDQGILAALTPLRDLAGLADNLPLLLCAVYLVFRASSGTLPPPGPSPGRSGEGSGRLKGSHRMGMVSGWATLIWGCGALYLLYRLVARASGSAELPVGGCLVAEAVVIPLMMLVCDGFLLAWVLAEIRTAGFEGVIQERFHPAHALELMPAAALGCALALPARYVAAFVILTLQHLPTSIGPTMLGRYIRWQLGWGLVDLQGAALVGVGLIGVVAWSRGSLSEVLHGFRRLLEQQAGRLVALLAMAGAGSALLAAVVYPLVLLLPPAGWVLPAADSYSHYLTLPVGLWTLAALIEVAESSLPVAGVAEAHRETIEALAAEPADAPVMTGGE